MAQTVLHRADTRGHAHHGWLEARHSFSFAQYYDPQRVHFGVLRVLNDDAIAGRKGFGMHPHDNMEIITIPLEGELQHKDSMGHTAVIRPGDVQVMSAGTGVYHSEFNHGDDTLKLLQIWVFPNRRNVEPRYDQIALDIADRHNRLQQILSPDPNDEGVWIHQKAWFHLGAFDAGFKTQYTLKGGADQGVYAFVISGEITLDGQKLGPRDALGIWNTEQINLVADTTSEILLMEIPMQLEQ